MSSKPHSWVQETVLSIPRSSILSCDLYKQFLQSCDLYNKRKEVRILLDEVRSQGLWVLTLQVNGKGIGATPYQNAGEAFLAARALSLFCHDVPCKFTINQ